MIQKWMIEKYVQLADAAAETVKKNPILSRELRFKRNDCGSILWAESTKNFKYYRAEIIDELLALLITQDEQRITPDEFMQIADILGCEVEK